METEEREKWMKPQKTGWLQMKGKAIQKTNQIALTYNDLSSKLDQ